MTQTVITASGTWTVPVGVIGCDVLVVGGGGSGGGNDANNGAGGGGAGAVNWTTGLHLTPGETVTVTIGAGGAAVTGTGTTPVGTGNDGGTSSFVPSVGGPPVTATGGGGGGRFAASNSAPNGEGRPGVASGASGGGGGTSNSSGYPPAGGASGGGSGTAGGAGNGATTISGRRGGGGGGAGGAGGSGATVAGTGGAGVNMSAQVGTSVGAAGWFGGGGGGGIQSGASAGGAGGTGGGGNGGGSSAATNGAANTGGGGGGARTATQPSGAGGSGVVVVVYTVLPAPGVPTSVTVAPGVSTIAMGWSAPSTGGPVTSYEARIGAGTPVTATSPHTFSGLASSTSYTVEVRAVGPGGTSSWVATTVSTLADGPDVLWHADIRVGSLTWSIDYAEDADPDVPNVLAGASFTWSAPDDVGWPPPIHVTDRDVCTLTLFTPDAGLVGDVRRGDLVRFKFTPIGYTWDAPLIDFAGRVRDAKITDRPTPLGGAFLQLTAADHLVTLQDWTIRGETLISTDGDTQAMVLDRISEVLDATEAAENHDMVPGSFGHVLNPADAAHFTGTVGDYTIPADGQVTAFDLFGAYGMTMMPVPQYDDTTGELDHTQPFVIAYLDPYGRYPAECEVDACHIPTESVTWRRDYTPNIVEYEAGGFTWAGQTWGTPVPDYPDWNLTRPNLDGFNLFGFNGELPEDGAWGPFEFTHLAYKDPTAVRGWLTVPDRWHTRVTITGTLPGFDPNTGADVAGLLRQCTWSMGDNGKWVIDAGIRRTRGASPPAWDTVSGSTTWDGTDPTLTWDDALLPF